MTNWNLTPLGDSKTALFVILSDTDSTFNFVAALMYDRGRVAYNDLCRKCQHKCKQSFRAVVIDCPHYLSKRAKRKEKIS